MPIWLEISLFLVFLLANAIFAMSEFAVVSLRRIKLAKAIEEGDERAKAALELHTNPNLFLSTTQLGITLVGTLAAGVSGAGMTKRFAEWMTSFQLSWLSESTANIIASFLILTLLIPGVTVVVGELLPKRLALTNPEGFAMTIAKPMMSFARLMTWPVNLLSWTTDFILKIFRVKHVEEAGVSEEEVRQLIDQGLSTGVFEQSEKEMVEGVLDLDRQWAEDIMTPRAHMVWVNIEDSDDGNWRKIIASGHSDFPVYQGTRDHVVGMVSVKSLWANQALGGKKHLKDLLTQPLFVPVTMPANKLLETFKRSGRHIALVTDEFGGIQGLVSVFDVLESIVGDIPGVEDDGKPIALQRGDGSWLFDAMIEIDVLKEKLGIEAFPDEDEGEYQTLSGFILYHLGYIPVEGEKFKWEGYTFEIIDLDRHKIDKVLVVPYKAAEVETPAPAQS
jgi:putative hemolysin